MKKKLVKVELEALDRLRNIGQQMSNYCFNYGQHGALSNGTYTIDKRNLEMMFELYRHWDEASAVVHGQANRALMRNQKKSK